MIEFLFLLFLAKLAQFCIVRDSYYKAREVWDTGWRPVDTAPLGWHIVRHSHGPEFRAQKVSEDDWRDETGTPRDPHYWRIPR